MPRRRRGRWPSGTANKATVEALVAEIRIANNQAIPVFKIPGDPHGHHREQPPVRTMASCGPPGTRTLNLLIKSQQLCRLS